MKIGLKHRILLQFYLAERICFRSTPVYNLFSPGTCILRGSSERQCRQLLWCSAPGCPLHKPHCYLPEATHDWQAAPDSGEGQRPAPMPPLSFLHIDRWSRAAQGAPEEIGGDGGQAPGGSYLLPHVHPLPATQEERWRSSFCRAAPVSFADSVCRRRATDSSFGSQLAPQLALSLQIHALLSTCLAEPGFETGPLSPQCLSEDWIIYQELCSFEPLLEGRNLTAPCSDRSLPAADSGNSRARGWHEDPKGPVFGLGLSLPAVRRSW